MVRRESEALLAATQRLIDETDVDQRFVADDVRGMHRTWLGEIYQWAGDYRSVNMTKDGFMFAAADQVPRLMREFEHGPLRDFLLADSNMSKNRLARSPLCTSK